MFSTAIDCSDEANLTRNIHSECILRPKLEVISQSVVSGLCIHVYLLYSPDALIHVTSDYCAIATWIAMFTHDNTHNSRVSTDFDD